MHACSHVQIFHPPKAITLDYVDPSPIHGCWYFDNCLRLLLPLFLISKESMVERHFSN